MSATPTTDPKDQTRLQDVLEGFSDGMLITLDPEGRPRARPMSVADREDGGVLWFVTSKETTKVDEVQDQDGTAAVTMQSPTSHLSMSGTVRVVDDDRVLKDLWSETMKVWFPDGPTESDAVALRFEPEVGEYWDMSGTKGLRYALDAAKAYFRSEPLDPSVDDTHGQTAL